MGRGTFRAAKKTAAVGWGARDRRGRRARTLVFFAAMKLMRKEKKPMAPEVGSPPARRLSVCVHADAGRVRRRCRQVPLSPGTRR